MASGDECDDFDSDDFYEDDTDIVQTTLKLDSGGS
jgi:hypothetical protein